MIDYDKDIFGEVDDLDVDVKLNPDYYIHNAILSAQKSILLSTMEGKTSDGINAYMIFINQIKLISDSAGYINKETLSLISVEEEKIKTVKDVKEKLSYYGIIFGLILNDLFSRKARIGSLVLNVKNREVNNDYEKGLKMEE